MLGTTLGLGCVAQNYRADRPSVATSRLTPRLSSPDRSGDKAGPEGGGWVLLRLVYTLYGSVWLHESSQGIFFASSLLSFLGTTLALLTRALERCSTNGLLMKENGGVIEQGSSEALV